VADPGEETRRRLAEFAARWGGYRGSVLVEQNPVEEELRKLRKSLNDASKKLLRAGRSSQQPPRRPGLRGWLAQVLGRLRSEGSGFEQEKCW